MCLNDARQALNNIIKKYFFGSNPVKYEIYVVDKRVPSSCCCQRQPQHI